MAQGLVQHFVESDRVHEQASVYSIDVLNLHVLAMQEESVNLIPLQWLFLGRLKDDSWDVEVLSIRQSLVYPGFDDPCIQHIACVLHGHNLGDTYLKSIPISHFILSDALDSVVDETVVAHYADIIREALAATLRIHVLFSRRNVPIHARSKQGFTGPTLPSLSLHCREVTSTVYLSRHQVMSIFDILSKLASLSDRRSSFRPGACLFELKGEDVTSQSIDHNRHS